MFVAQILLVYFSLLWFLKNVCFTPLISVLCSLIPYLSQHKNRIQMLNLNFISDTDTNHVKAATRKDKTNSNNNNDNQNQHKTSEKLGASRYSWEADIQGKHKQLQSYPCAYARISWVWLCLNEVLALSDGTTMSRCIPLLCIIYI